MQARHGQLCFLFSGLFHSRSSTVLRSKASSCTWRPFYSMKRTLSMTISRRPFGSREEKQRCTLMPGCCITLHLKNDVLWLEASFCFNHCSFSSSCEAVFHQGYISKACRISHRHRNHYKTGYLTCPWNLLNKCCPVIDNIFARLSLADDGQTLLFVSRIAENQLSCFLSLGET